MDVAERTFVWKQYAITRTVQKDEAENEKGVIGRTDVDVKDDSHRANWINDVSDSREQIQRDSEKNQDMGPDAETMASIDHYVKEKVGKKAGFRRV